MSVRTEKNDTTYQASPIPVRKSRSSTDIREVNDPTLDSNASNFNNPVTSQVDSRTGTLRLTIAPPYIPGYFGRIITPSIHYVQESKLSRKSMYGLPWGWKYNYSFIHNSRVFINGTSSYYMDSLYKSGLRYYKLDNLEFKRYGRDQKFPYDKSISYTSRLSFYSGETQYFDSNGRLVGIDDRFTNHVMLYYDREGNIYESKISKIIDSHGQAVTFTYTTEHIIVTYPSGGRNEIQFRYLIDKDTRLFKGYQDPLGHETLVENTGGIVRRDLISKISYPNRLVVSYGYATLLYYHDSGMEQPSRLDCIDVVEQKGPNNTRTTKYTYNLEGQNRTNYTGYPDHFIVEGRDSLLQSPDNKYRYITKVDDGILITEHRYNRLHLELETYVYVSQGPTQLVSHTIYTYKDQGTDGDPDYFPDYLKLSPNYQTPVQVLLQIYGDEKQSRTHQTVSKFDDYGNPIEVTSYQTDLQTNQQILIRTDKTGYFDYRTSYGQIASKESYDYTKDQKNPVIRKEENILTMPHCKTIATTTNYLMDIEEQVFKADKRSSFAYDDQGRVVYEKVEWVDQKAHPDPSLIQHRTTYSLSGSLLTITDISVDPNTDAGEELVVVKTVDSTTDWTIKESDAAGNAVIYEYDNIGRRTKKIVPFDSITDVVTVCHYDDSIGKITTQYAKEDDQSKGYETYTYYDTFGDLIEYSDNLGPEGSARVLKTRKYNNKGQLSEEQGILGSDSKTTYLYDNRGRISSVTDALQNIITYTYDPVAQTKTMLFNQQTIKESIVNDTILQENLYSSVSADPTIQLCTHFDAYQKIRSRTLGDTDSPISWSSIEYSYDASLMTSAYILAGSDKIVGRHVYQRDLFGNPNLETIELALPNSTTLNAKSDQYRYNNLNQLIEERNNLNQSHKYSYNNVGLQERYIDYTGTVFKSTYYPNNLLHKLSYTDKSGNEHLKEYTYYRSRQIKSITESSGNMTQKLQYTYTIDDKLKSILYPDGKKVQYIYDTEKDRLDQFIDTFDQITQYSYLDEMGHDYGRITEIRIVGSNQKVNFTYYTKDEDPANSGKIKSILTSNNIEKTYTYDGFGSVKTLTLNDRSRVSPASILLKMQYLYYPITRNISEIQYSSSLDPQNQGLNYRVKYEYNSLNQLIKQTTTNLTGLWISKIKYEYDAANNLQTQESVGPDGQSNVLNYTYDADNKLIKIADSAKGQDQQLEYDINGNLTNDGTGSTFQYNEQNQLIGYENQNKNIQVNYTYYPNGLRASKEIYGSSSVQFYYDGNENANIINEIQSHRHCSYLIVGAERYVRLIHDDKMLTIQYPIDNLKDVIGVLDDTNSFRSNYIYDAYGREIESPKLEIDLSNNPFKYSNEYVDIESGLIYLRSRYYNSGIKRFISRDKTMLINRYNYADSNPVMNTDPSGQMSWQAILAISLGTVLAVAGTVLTLGLAAPILAGLGVTLSAATIATLSGTAVAVGAGAAAGAGFSSLIYGAQHQDSWGSKEWREWGIGLAVNAAAGASSAGLGIAATKWIDLGLKGSTTLGRLGSGLVGRSIATGAADGAINVVYEVGIESVEGNGFSGKNIGIAAAIGFGSGFLGGFAGSRSNIASRWRNIRSANREIRDEIGLLGEGRTFRGSYEPTSHVITARNGPSLRQNVDVDVTRLSPTHMQIEFSGNNQPNINVQTRALLALHTRGYSWIAGLGTSTKAIERYNSLNFLHLW